MCARLRQPGGGTAIIYLYTHEYAIFVYCVVIIIIIIFSYMIIIIIDMYANICVPIIIADSRSIGRRNI